MKKKSFILLMIIAERKNLTNFSHFQTHKKLITQTKKRI